MTPEPALIAQRYRLLARLGSGAMGEVWKAQDVKFDRRFVAIKLLRDEQSRREDAERREHLLSQLTSDSGSGGVPLGAAAGLLREALQSARTHDEIADLLRSRADGADTIDAEAVLGVFDDLIGDPSYSHNAKLRARVRRLFNDEAESVANLRHDNIVGISDRDVEDGVPWLAMEFIEGRTLNSIIRSGDHVPRTQQLRWMEELCAGLAYAHAQHLVHRDIKPANLIVEASTNTLKILDFGVVRRLQNLSESMVGVPVGTLAYMSPEQLLGSADLDHRSDIFSVGAVFYELLTLRRAFPAGDSVVDLFHRIANEHPMPASYYVTDLQPELERILDKALAKKPDDRYQDLTAMRRDLARARVSIEFEEERSQRTVQMPAGAMVHLAVARQALADGDLEAADAALAQAEQAHADEPELTRLRGELAHARRLDEKQLEAVRTGLQHRSIPDGAGEISVPVPPVPASDSHSSRSQTLQHPGTIDRIWPALAGRTVPIVLGLVALLAIASGVYLWRDYRARTPERTTTAGGGTTSVSVVTAPVPVSFDLQPWGEVRILDARRQEVGPPKTTPFVVELAPGEYVFEYRNPVLGASESVPIRVEPNAPQVISQTMKGYDVEKVLRDLLGPPR